LKINVTKTYLPSKEKYQKYVDKIYESGWITNNGPLVQELEKRLAEYLDVKNIVLVANGTLALEVAYRVLDLKGEVLTTPFSFVATTTSLINCGLKPLFCDIDTASLNLDPQNMQELINEKTSAIVPVHVFGNACNVEEIAKIAKKNNLKIIYDAAHAFGVKYKNRSLLSYGDISTLSFHATKLFHTIEGGALIIDDDKLAKKARNIINFGIESAESITNLGTNAKMNEFEAAMGLCILDDIKELQSKRKILYDIYIKELNKIVKFPQQNSESTINYSYFPIILKDDKERLTVEKALQTKEVFPRRYFYPSLDTLNFIEPKQFCSISRDISTKILCLPLYSELTVNEQKMIIKIIKEQF